MCRQFAVFFLFVFSVSVNADVVKWIDSEGNTHYSNKAPKQHKKGAKKIEFVTYKKPEKTEVVVVPVSFSELDWKSKAKESDGRIKQENRKTHKKNRQRNAKLKKLSITELRAQCDIAREKRLAPARAEAIEACIEKNERQTKNVVAYCERFNRTFGDETVGGFSYYYPHILGYGGYYNYRKDTTIRSPRLFHNIPECRALYRAEDKRNRLNRGYRN